MQNEALQAALALYHAPNERFSLARAELPRDIGFALRLASAPQPLLQDAAAELGESEAVLLEAIRFYLQLMLFQPEANAYRVLGLAPDAPQNQIREHHRWLQRWLHPDRRGEDWTSYAPRVNWAWNQLHNERARHDYDLEQVAYHAEDGAAVAPEHPRVRPNWMHAAATRERMTWGQRLGLAVLVGCCGVLLYLASTRQDTPPADMPVRSAATTKTDTATPPATDTGPTLAQVRKAMEQQAPADPIIAPAAALPEATRTPTPTPTQQPEDPSAQARGKSEPAPARTAAPAHAQETPSPDNKAAATTASDAAPPTSAAPPPAAPIVRVAAAAAAPAHALPDATALVRARLANSRVQELSQFFGAPDQNVPPIWNDAQGQSAAERERRRLHERVRWDGAGDFSVETPVWRLSENLAALDAAYRVRKGQSVSESGKLSLRMVWREEMWLVTQVALEPAP